jgi:hypothetical protein
MQVRDDLKGDLAVANKAVRAAKSALNSAKTKALNGAKLDASWARVQGAYDEVENARLAVKAAKAALATLQEQGKRDLAITSVQQTLSASCRAACRQILDLGVQNAQELDQALRLADGCSKMEKDGIDSLIEQVNELEVNIISSTEEMVIAGDNAHRAYAAHGRLRKEMLIEGTRKERRALKDAEYRVQKLVADIKAINRKLGQN